MSTIYLTAFPKATDMQTVVDKYNNKQASEKRAQILDKLSIANLTNRVQCAAKKGEEVAIIQFDNCSAYEFEEIMKDSAFLSAVVDDLTQLGYKVDFRENIGGFAILLISWEK